MNAPHTIHSNLKKDDPFAFLSPLIHFSLKYIFQAIETSQSAACP